MTIWKYPIPLADMISLPLPAGAQVLSVQVQHGEPVIWALVDSDADSVPRRFAIYGTGHQVTRTGRFIGTFQLHGGDLVFHLFELGPPW